MVSEICLNQELQNSSLESKMVALHSNGEVSCKFLDLKRTNKKLVWKTVSILDVRMMSCYPFVNLRCLMFSLPI